MSGAEQGTALARHYLHVDQPRRALDVLERLTDADLEDAELWELRAAALHALERPAEAARAAREGLARAPESPYLLYLLSACEAQLGDAAAAERAILSCLRLAPESAPALCHYALLVAKAGQVAKAARLVEEAARLDPEGGGVARARMIVAYLQGTDDELDRHGKARLAADPDDALTHHLLGQAMLESGRIDEASRHLRTAARLDPGDHDLADAAREARFASHWLLKPLWPMRRFGAIPVWIAALVVIYGLKAAGSRVAAGLLGLAYFVYCLYSWIVPPLLRRWMGLSR
ncbi:tetratricopeptide repeat protein [Sorangium sp. So ce269]